MSVDFPRAWEITRATQPEYHHNRCSYNTHAMLCDCDILMKHQETLDKETFYGAGGRVIRADSAEQGKEATDA